MEDILYAFGEDMGPEIDDVETIVKSRKKRMLVGSTMLAMSLLFMQLAILILIGVLELSVMVAIGLIFLAPVLLAIGLYMLIFLPPIVLK